MIQALLADSISEVYTLPAALRGTSMLELGEELAAALKDRYAIERELGRGGMAIVYLARDLKHDRAVAIKVLRPELSTSIGAERFLREINIAARLTHPNILSLYESGDVEGMLYYVMPYVAGESLRTRLTRERQLPIDEALGVTRQVASALDYAHAMGVVHRDIKPENILLLGNQVLVADFGLARAVGTSDRLTDSGIAVGTPAYISPEQASAERSVDGRTDVYSLGCVVFEMIAGVPPFRGATAQVVIAHHVTAAPPSLSEERTTCPPAMDAAVRKALAKAPADRFRSPGEFVRGLDASVGESAARTSGRGILSTRPAWRRPAILGSAIALIVLVSAAVAARFARGSGVSLDQSRYLALPLSTLSNVSTSSNVASEARQHLSNALAQWSDVHLVDERTLRESLEDPAKTNLRTSDALRLARRLGAGRLVWGELATTADSVVVHASLYDVMRGTSLREGRIRYAIGSTSLVEPYRVLANRLLRERDELPWTTPDQSGQASLRAWTAYDSARRALETWDLGSAERRLREALQIEPDFPQAELWLAQALSWSTFDRSPQESQRLRDEQHSLLTKALTSADRLSEADRLRAAGLQALAENRDPEACVQFRSLLKLEPNDFGAWYGLGDCLVQDSAVVSSSRSPSGYAFRGSWNSGAAAYERAIETLPAQPPDFVYRRLARVLTTEPARYRIGRLVSDSSLFVSPPVLLNDTLAHVPYPSRPVPPAFLKQASVNQAIQANIDRLGRSLQKWVRLSPLNPLAHEMLGALLEKAGVINASAEDSLSAASQIRAAQALTVDSLHRLTLSVTLVRLAIKADSFASAATLADSILHSIRKPTAKQAPNLVGLAALLGHRRQTAELLRPLMEFPRFGPTRSDGRPVSAPPAVLDLAADGSARADLGVCDDSLKTFSTRLDETLVSYVPDSSSRANVRDAVSWPILSASVPCLGPSATASLASRDFLVQLQQRLATSGRSAFVARFDSIQSLRKGLRPGDIAINYTYQESWLLLAAGDTAGAVEHLDRTLDALPTLSTQVLDFPLLAASLVRAMALRAELAEQRGEHAKATRWAGAVAALWSHEDPELAPVVSRMRVIVKEKS